MQIPEGQGHGGRSARTNHGLPSSSRRMSEVAMRGKRPRRHAGESQVRGEVAARGRPDASSAGIRRGPAAKLFKINAPPAPGISTLPGRPTESKFPRVCNQGTSATSSSLEPVASSSFGVLGQEFSAPRQPSDITGAQADIDQQFDDRDDFSGIVAPEIQRDLSSPPLNANPIPPTSASSNTHPSPSFDRPETPQATIPPAPAAPRHIPSVTQPTAPTLRRSARPQKVRVIREVEPLTARAREAAPQEPNNDESPPRDAELYDNTEDEVHGNLANEEPLERVVTPCLRPSRCCPRIMLNKLPDEIVVNIVERCSEPRPFACASLFAPPPHHSKSYEALKWSHLSKHHRALMRGTASLWTWISSDMHPALIQECLQLSSDLALDVEISAKHTETDSLQALLHPPSSTRWSSLLMRIPLIQNGRPGFAVTTFKDLVRDFYVDLKGLQLPNLSRLCLIHEQEVFEVYYDRDRPISWFGTIYDTWSAPHIREIVTNGGDSLSLQFRNTITKLTFTLHILQHIEDVGRLISTFGFVRELCIRWSTNRGGIGTISGNPGEIRTPWPMPSVSVLRLELETDAPDTQLMTGSIGNLLASILFPNLSTLHIQITTFPVQHNATHTFTSKYLLDVLLYGRPPEVPAQTFRFPSISAFEFRMHGNPCLPSDWLLPVHEFRMLQRLTLKGISMELFPSEDGKHLDYYASQRPPSTLQAITLEDCDRITTEGLTTFLEALQEIQDEVGLQNQLERVTVVRCKCIDVVELGVSLKSTEFFCVS